MSGVTDIEWAGRVWNPLRGCSRKSPGCRNCYAERLAWRFGSKPGQPYHGLVQMTAQGPRWTGKVLTVPEALKEPLHWVKPADVFVNSMSDLFHEEVPFEFIADVFAIMGCTTRHTYKVLTKCPERMAEFFDWLDEDQDSFGGSNRIQPARAFPEWIPARGTRGGYDNCGPAWPFDNVLLGVSVENQRWADARISALREVAHRGWRTWVSYEPALGPVDWSPWMKFVSWLVCGGESGPDANPMHPDWARAARDICAAWGKPFFFKQWGAWCTADAVPDDEERTLEECWMSRDGTRLEPGEAVAFFGGDQVMYRAGKKGAGRVLDGVLHDAQPEVR